MKYQNFLIRLTSLAMIVGVLFFYNSIASARQELIKNNEQLILKVEAYNESIKGQENKEKESSVYVDGTWEGTGTGFGGEIKVSVTVQEGKIKNVEIISAKSEDPAYFDMAKVLTKRIVEAQNTKLDTISGATYSSNGILDATTDALSKAVKK